MSNPINDNEQNDGFIFLLEPPSKPAPGSSERVIELAIQSEDLLGLKRRMLELLESSEDVTIDAGKLRQPTAACMQLLCAFAMRAGVAGVALRWQGQNPAFIALARQLDFARHLGLGA